MNPLDLVPPIAEAKRVGKLVAALAVAVVVLAGLVAVLGFMADPFSWRKHKIEHLEQSLETKTDDLAGRSLEVKGERAAAQRLDVVVHQQQDGAAALAAVVEQARQAPDANELLPAARADRLLAADRQLCDKSRLRGCEPAAPADARPGG